ncbi:MAG: DUF58 domain-containing protein [Nanoarchaeota archaeon]|nr:DUF58 domain-containing protein [Nanoarchaeota archaeon]
MGNALNVDIPKSIERFESLINKILPKKIFFKLLLRGKGLEFDSYRSFSLDEDASSIDWKASVRANTLLAKQYIEERDLKIMFLVDVSENMVFGSQEKLKCEYSTELVSALSNTMINAGDKIGFMLFSNKIISMSFPNGGKKQFEIFVSNLVDSNSYGGSSDIRMCIESAQNIIHKDTSLVIIVSDFLRVDGSYIRTFEEIGAMYETIALIVRDPLDNTLPDLNKEIVIEDPETREKLIINPMIAKNTYEQFSKKQLETLKNILIKSNIDFLELSTAEDFVLNLATFLKRRVDEKKRG